MAEPGEQSDTAETEAAQQRAAEALERGVEEIETPADAIRTLDVLEKSAGDLREVEVASEHPADAPREQAAAIEDAGDGAAASTPAAVIATAAAESANASADQKAVVDEAVTLAMSGADRPGAPGADARSGRRLLRRELFRRLRPLQAIDAFIFVQINHLPHTPRSDRMMAGFSWIMTAGTGYLFILLLAVLIDRRRGWHAARAVAPALWLATITVEYPIKKWFRRRRPFISLVQAIIVGRRPGSYSFPSGHSAAAFAGALLLARQFPSGARGFFGLAALVAFSRIYLGAHYPGDVVSGSMAGMILARVYARLLRRIGIAPEEAVRRLRDF